MIRRIFRPFTVITLVGFIIALFFSPKPGVHIIHDGPSITNIVNTSNLMFLGAVLFGTFGYFLLGVVIEVAIWMIKRHRING